MRSFSRYLVRVVAQRDAKCTRQTKVSQLQISILVNEQVLRLQIAVENSVRVAKGNAANELSQVALRHYEALLAPQEGRNLHNFGRHALRRRVVHVLFQVQVQVFKDQVQFRVVMNDVEQADNIAVRQFLQQRNLADGGRGHAFVLGLQANLFQRHCIRERIEHNRACQFGSSP
jgi:hypothetical protein